MDERKKQILPIGLLMKEHRLIERMIAVLKKEAENLESGSDPDIFFIEQTADFIKIYADECHHGKEEDVLFRDLAKKELSKEHFRIMQELIAEHQYGRKVLKELIDANGRCKKGDKSIKAEVINCLKALVGFYPGHIEKEDKHFFLPSMDYFSRKEKDDMLKEFREFDELLIHKKYSRIVQELEESKNAL